MRSRRLQRAGQDLALAGIIGLVVAGVTLVGGLALIEHDFQPEGGLLGLPTRIPACGRSFIHPATDARIWTLADITAARSPGLPPIVFEPTIGDIPLLAPFERPRAGMTTCDVLVFLHVGPDAYVAYVLEGGP